MSFKENLLRIIKNLSVSEIYYMGPSLYVKRGFEYYRQGRVEYLRWKNNSLEIGVYGSRLYHVIISDAFPDGGGLSCDCPDFTPQTFCKHVICTLMTLKNLLDPSVLSAGGIDPEKRQRLAEFLHTEEESEGIEQLYQLIIQPDADQTMYLEHRGKKCDYFYLSHPMHYKFLKFIRKLHSGNYIRDDLQNLEIPVIYRHNGKEIMLNFDNTLRYRAYTEVELGRRKMTISKRVRCTGDTTGETVVVNRIVVHLHMGVFSIVENTEGWSFFYKIVPSYYGYSSLSLPYSDEIELYMQGTEFLKDVVFLYRNVEIQPEEVSPSYLIMVKIENGLNGRMAEIRPILMLKNIEYGLYSPLIGFFNGVANGEIGPLRRFQHRKRVMEALFCLRKTMTQQERDSLIRDVIVEINGKKPDKEYLKSYLKGYFLNHHQGGIKHLILGNGTAFIYTVEIDRQIMLLETLYRCFGDHIFRSFHAGSMNLPLEEFEKHLTALYSMAKSRDIEVFIEGKPIRVSKWDISITLNRDIDWFKLHPEIRVKGKDISENLWKAIREGKTGYVIGNDAIEVMDAETEEKLKHLIKTLSLQKKRKEKDMVKIPRLQVLDWIELRKHGINISLPPEDERIINSLLNFKGISHKPLPKGISVSLRDYQKEGYEWLCFLYEHRLGACLADDMGLGKTIQAISLLAAAKEGLLQGISEDNPPHLVIVPPSLLFNWESELKKFYPEMRVYQYTGSKRTEDFNNYDVVLTSYGILRRDISLLTERQFHVIVFDEAQAIKNIHADTTAAVRQLKGYFRLALTGTPLENHIGEYYSIIDLVLPGLLGEYREFKKHIKTEDEEVLNMIIKRTVPFVLRRTKEDVLKELPPKVETDIYLDLTEEQKTLYERTVREVKVEVDEAYRNKPPAQAGIVALAALLKLRQICLCPALLSREFSVNSPKIDILVERLHTLMKEKHSALVFSQFTSFLDIVEERLRQDDIPYVRLDGSTPVRTRKTLVRQFQDGKDAGVFLLSLKAGGQGLNLTRATYVFHLDPWWNPAVESQATDRSHRIGQSRKVTVIRLLMKHSIEEKIMLLKQKKKALYDAVIGYGVSSSGMKITHKDMEFLLGT